MASRLSAILEPYFKIYYENTTRFCFRLYMCFERSNRVTERRFCYQVEFCDTVIKFITFQSLV